MKATLPQELAIGVAQHRTKHQGRGEATAHETGGIAECRGYQLHPNQQQQGDQGDATVTAQQGLDRVVADPQHLGKHQGHAADSGTTGGRDQAGWQGSEQLLKPGVAAEGHQADQGPRHQARQ